MFTDGLDKNGLRWVREKEITFSNSRMRIGIDPITSIHSSGRGIGLPPPSNFRSGHLPSSVIPFSRTLLDAHDRGSASDKDMTSDSEEGTYGGRYSLESSPQDDRIANGIIHRFGNSEKRPRRYGSEYTYSDVSSSRETLVARQGHAVNRLARGNGRYPVVRNSYSDEDESDSAASSEFSSTHPGSVSASVTRCRMGVSEGYASSVPNVVNGNLQSRNKNHENMPDDDNDDIPTAPAFCGSGQEIKEGDEKIPLYDVRSATNVTNSRSFSTVNNSNKSTIMSAAKTEDDTRNKNTDHFVRTTANAEANASSYSNPARVPTFHASALGPWHAVIAYDACVRLCLHAWSKSCMEAPLFLENECALLRDAFGLQQVLLQSEEELMSKRSSEPASEGVASKPKKIIGRMKVQVRKVKTALDPPTGCSMSALGPPSIKMESIRYHFSNFQSMLVSALQALRKIQVTRPIPAKRSLRRQSLAYVHASTRYIKQVSGLLKTGVTNLRNSSSSYEALQETYYCLLRLKSSTEEDAIKLQPGSGETHVFFPDSLGDDLIVEVQDSKGKYYGRVLAQVATIAEDLADKVRWWSIYREPEHELVGKLQLYVNYSTSADDNSHLKCGSVAETVAYDMVLEVAMKVQHFQQRNLLLYGSWKWLLTEFASYYGVSDVYVKLRWLHGYPL